MQTRWPIPLMALLLLAVVASPAAGVLTPTGTVNVAVRSGSGFTRTVGDIFLIDIRLEGSDPVCCSDVGLTFNPAHLAVVDAAGNPVSNPADGIIVGPLPLISVQVNNSTGKVQFGAALFSGAQATPLTLFQVRFRALAPAAASPLTLMPEITYVLDANANLITGSLINGTLVILASPTATPTPTMTPTFSPTPTPTATPTFTPTPTPSQTPTSTLTPTPLPSPTPTATRTASPSPTITRTPSPSPSPTITHTPPPSPTPTATFPPSVTPTATPSPTPTASSTLPPAASPTPTATLSPVPTATATPTPTHTPTASATATASPTATSTPVMTPTPTATATATPRLAVLCVLAFHDLSGNLRHEPGEPLVAGALISVRDADQRPTWQYTTDGVSEPMCADLAPGIYYVKLGAPAGYEAAGPAWWGLALASETRFTLGFALQTAAALTPTPSPTVTRTATPTVTPRPAMKGIFLPLVLRQQ